MITLDDLTHICKYARTQTLATFEQPLRDAMNEFDIVTPKRVEFFIAQILHESGEFLYVRELASGETYEGRADLGNNQPGDGVRFRGRGLIQITGRANYALCGQALGLDLLAHPELLETPVNACRSAGWFWATHGLNALADEGDFLKATKRINGGTNGLADREMYLARTQNILGGIDV